jgi:hypothetical protein
LGQGVTGGVCGCHLTRAILARLLQHHLLLLCLLQLQLHLLLLRLLLLQGPQILNVGGHPAKSGHDIFLYTP